MNSGERDAIVVEATDLMQRMTPQMRKVTLVMLITMGRDEKSRVMTDVLGFLSAMTEGELRGLLRTLQEQGWSA